MTPMVRIATMTPSETTVGIGQTWDPFHPTEPGPSTFGSATADLSDGRTLGSGFQVDFPVFYGASMRFWFYRLDLLAVEVIAFGSDLEYDELLEATVRGLCKFYDSVVTDLYGAVGMTYKYDILIPHVALGVEVSLSSEIAVNFEAGISVVWGDTVPFLGGGVHFYW